MTDGLPRMLGAEWRKASTTKLPWVLALVAVVFASVQAGTLVLLASGLISDAAGVPVGEEMLMEPEYLGTLLAQVGTASTFVLLIGIVAMTGEYRHMTITSTYLASPRRSRVLVAKMIAYGAIGAVVALVGTAAVTATTAVALLPFDHAPITVSMVGSVLLGAVIGLVLYALLGVSVGALIPNQVAAIVTALVWTLLIEAVLSLLFPAAAKWLPGGALNSAMDVGLRAEFTGAFTEADSLPAWGGMLVLLAYAAVFGAVASRTTLRRDIT